MMMYRCLISLSLIGIIGGCSPSDGDSKPEIETNESGVVAAPEIMPDTEIFLARLSIDGDILSLATPHNVTTHVGYDNQPYFLPEKATFLYSSQGQSGKTDIWSFDIHRTEKTQITFSTDVSEYSPRLTPDGKFLSYIQENVAGDVTQVYKQPLSGGDGEAVIGFAPLGYYAWNRDGSKLAVFYRSEPATLYVVDVVSGEQTLISENIGRGLYALNDGATALFTTLRDDGGTQVNKLDFESLNVTPLFPLVGQSQDYVILPPTGPDGHQGFFSAEGDVIYYRESEDPKEDWRPVAELSAHGLNNITRMAVSDDGVWLAIVAEARG